MDGNNISKPMKYMHTHTHTIYIYIYISIDKERENLATFIMPIYIYKLQKVRIM